MATKRNAVAERLSQNRLIARQQIASAFKNCLTNTDTDYANAAKSLGVAKRTIGSWSRAETPITVEIVLAAPGLAKAFRRELCGDHATPAPYIAKKVKR